MNFPVLLETVRKNCEITDARHARNMTMCTYLLEMQQYYRWENSIPYAESLPREKLGNWLVEKEKSWSEIETLPYLAIDGEIDPFDSDAVNRRILQQGLVYGAGYGRFGKPHFFLGRLADRATREGFSVLVSECEYARDLTSPVAALQGSTIFLRREAVKRMIWERREELRWKGRASPYSCGDADCESMLESACEAVILHEIGEGMAGALLGKEWEEMLSGEISPHEEILARAMRDLLADCLSTLPSLVLGKDPIAIHFHFEHFKGMRRELFPMALDAYRQWSSDGNVLPLLLAAEAGREHWLAECRKMLCLHESGEALQEQGAGFIL